jgi:hypothetical protein
MGRATKYVPKRSKVEEPTEYHVAAMGFGSKGHWAYPL